MAGRSAPEVIEKSSKTSATRRPSTGDSPNISAGVHQLGCALGCAWGTLVQRTSQGAVACERPDSKAVPDGCPPMLHLSLATAIRMINVLSPGPEARLRSRALNRPTECECGFLRGAGPVHLTVRGGVRPPRSVDCETSWPRSSRIRCGAPWAGRGNDGERSHRGADPRAGGERLISGHPLWATMTRASTPLQPTRCLGNCFTGRGSEFGVAPTGRPTREIGRCAGEM